MENKLTWVELKKIVARKTHLNEKEVNLILSTWLDEMTAAVKRGEELHINGLGTFKMKKMKARKSVNVTTGEEIILPETDRLTYTMSAGLIEQLRDSAPARTTAGTDPIQKLSEQADEIMDIIGDIKAIGREEEEAKPEPIAIPEYQIPEAKPAQPTQSAEPAEPAKPVKRAKKERLWLTAGITILVFIGLLIGLFFFFQHKLEQWLTNLREQAEMVEVVDENVNVNENENVLVVDSLSESDTKSFSESESESPTANYREYTEFLGTEKMHQDSRLAWMAYRYYGNKKLWVFIYDANRDHLTSPEHIAVGTPIRIPRLSQEIIDLATPDLQELVQQMSDEFLGK